MPAAAAESLGGGGLIPADRCLYLEPVVLGAVFVQHGLPSAARGYEPLEYAELDDVLEAGPVGFAADWNVKVLGPPARLPAGVQQVLQGLGAPVNVYVGIRVVVGVSRTYSKVMIGVEPSTPRSL